MNKERFIQLFKGEIFEKFNEKLKYLFSCLKKKKRITAHILQVVVTDHASFIANSYCSNTMRCDKVGQSEKPASNESIAIFYLSSCGSSALKTFELRSALIVRLYSLKDIMP